MRFILIYKYGFFQRKTERVDIENCLGTNQVLDYLCKKLSRQDHEYIVRVKKDRMLFRVIRGWPVEHYELTEGTELQVDAPEKEQVDSYNANTSKNKYLTNLFGALMPTAAQGGPLEKINEEDEEKLTSFVSQDPSLKKSFNVRKYLDGQTERLLKEVQKGRTEHFLKILEEVPINVDDESLLQIELYKSNLINELGEGGWGAVHYAVYCNRAQILKELMKRNVELNRCTADGWLPVMIAVNRRNPDILNMLLSAKILHVNEVTSRGSALHIACRQGWSEGIKILLAKEADPKLFDDKGRTSFDVCVNEDCAMLMNTFKQQAEEHHNIPTKPTNFVPFTVSCLRGTVSRVRSLILTLSERYMSLDPYEGTLIYYQFQSMYPKKPLLLVPVASIRSVRMIKEKSWHMKSDYNYFEIFMPERQILACKHKNLAEAWVKGIFDSILYCNHNRKEGKEGIKRMRLLDDVSGNIVDPNESLKTTDKEPSYQKRVSIFKKHGGSLSEIITPPMQNSSMTDIKPQQSSSFRQPNPKLDISQVNVDTSAGSGVQPGSSNGDKSTSEDKKSLNQSFNSLVSDRICFASFDIVKTLGSGAFGKVFLARHIATNKMYALKALKKKTLIVKKQLKYAISEANVLKKANHPFIINLYFAFQTPHFLYLALDYCPGKDLNHHLAREVTLKESEARFYIAELVLAIQHLHERNIIYRDMKPENILLDGEGHIKLADFGLSKDNIESKTRSFCGSPAYLSPEMLTEKEVSKEADLYGIGCVLYEFLVGEPPYYSDQIPELYKNIKEAKLKFPKGISEQAKSIISGLLERDPKKRLGGKDFSQIFNHPFFNGMNWTSVLEKKITPPRRMHNESSEQDNSDDDEESKVIKSNKINFTDQDYVDDNKKMNRLINFSFIRSLE